MTEFANANNIKETSNTTGIGTYGLVGAVAGYQPFSLLAGKRTAYVARNASGVEVGQGLISVSPPQLTRDEIFSSSNGGARVVWAAPITITCTEPAQLSLSAANTAIDPPMRFRISTASQCLLKGIQGAEIQLQVLGVWRQVPVPISGVSISNAGLSPSTTYYAYAFSTVGVAVVLEFSTTGHVDDADRFVRVKSGDATRRLVGMVRTNLSTQFVDSNAQRLVLSWLQKRPVVGKIVGVANAVTASAIPVELSGGRRLEFLTWGGQSVDAEVEARAQNSVVNGSSDLRIAFDNVVAEQGAFATHPSAGGAVYLMVRDNSATLTEASHTVSPWGATGGAGTSTFVGGYNVTLVEVQG